MSCFFIQLCHLIFFILLLVFAYLQINDADPILWVSFYCLCALSPLLACFKYYSKWINSAVFVCALAVMVVYYPGFTEYLMVSEQESLVQGMSPNKPYIEEAREFIGAGIAAAIVTIYLLIAFFNNDKNLETKTG